MKLKVCIYKPPKYQPPPVADEERVALIAEIKNHIELAQYPQADKKIVRLGTESEELKSVIGLLYESNSSSVNNFETLMDYAKGTSVPEISTHLLEELWDEMLLSNITSDIPQLCEFYTTFKIKVLYSGNNNEELKTKVQSILASVIGPKIVADGVTELSYFVIRKEYEDFQKIADELYFANETIFDEAIRKVVDRTYFEMRFLNLVEAMWKLEKTPQKSTALCAIFHNLHPKISNNGQASMVIAYYLKKLKQLRDYSDIQDYKSHEVEKCIHELPDSVHALYFADNVCFRNIKYSNYLAKASKFDTYRHNVITQDINVDKNASFWILKPVDVYKLKIKNRVLNEFLYAGDEVVFLAFRRVFTWQAKDDYDGTDENRIIWHIEVNNNLLTITNMEKDTPLCAEDDEAVSTNFLTEPDKCIWTAESCEH